MRQHNGKAETRKRLFNIVAELSAHKERLSVLAVSKAAKIPRSVLYDSYPDVISKIRKLVQDERHDNPKSERRTAVEEIERLRAEVKALRTERDTIASESYALLSRALTAERLLEDFKRRQSRR